MWRNASVCTSTKSCACFVANPRNRPAFDRGHAVREQIRRSLIEHDPLALPLTAKALRTRLCPWLAERTVAWHIRQIRLEAEEAEVLE